MVLAVNNLDITQPLILNLSLDSDTFGPDVNVRRFSTYSFQVNFTYGMGDTAAGNISLQIRNKGSTVWYDAPGTSVAFTSASVSEMFGVAKADYHHTNARLKIDNTSGTGGTITVYFGGESPSYVN